MQVTRRIAILTAMNLFMMLSLNHIEVQANDVGLYEMKRVDEVSDSFEIHIEYPVFKKLKDKEFQEKLNKLVEARVETSISEVKKEAEGSSGFPILYYGESKIITNNNFHSVLMTKNISRGNTFSGEVQSLNFYNQSDAELIALTDVMDLSKINEAVTKHMEAEADSYFIEEFKGVRPDTAFYLEDDQLVLMFNKYEIAPGVYGTPEIKIPRNHHY
ncbi:DUF3298 and DUF4163 domain-containing protein [Thalassobacillus pellis]|uniref:DUF3298 and DUF4163 domain-containing protein n=1 Tax=Thalassobacillus pellis TaxID=748008 RepID=UPI001960BE13|nr:DUF3298 and DUF4163 domain-containing protein [Thalassobacillus pellis]MBM7553828.1 hypothetical protein [Thalassobacillus pellis]